jgi:hypothetical protein
MPKITHAAGPTIAGSDGPDVEEVASSPAGTTSSTSSAPSEPSPTPKQSRPRIACPQCGEPLEVGPYGERHCRYDGWIGV